MRTTMTIHFHSINTVINFHFILLNCHFKISIIFSLFFNYEYLSINLKSLSFVGKIIRGIVTSSNIVNDLIIFEFTSVFNLNYLLFFTN